MDPWQLTPDQRNHSLDGVDPDARPEFRALLDFCARQGWTVYISSATRDFAQQSDTASKVSCGWHQFGRAIDIGINGSTEWDPDTYGRLIAWWEARSPQHQTLER